jgi:hypothetical protein
LARRGSIWEVVGINIAAGQSANLALTRAAAVD